MMEENIDYIPWKQGKKNIKNAKILLEFPLSAIFPLLCPVEEYKWFPIWSCEMVYSQSGKAEQNAVFLTHESDGTISVETIITYEPPKIIEFLIVKETHSVERLSISLNEIKNNLTELNWTSMAITYSEKGYKKEQNSNDRTCQVFLDERKKELDYYLRNHEMIKKEGKH
jgi:hypothetical protein